MSTPPDNLVDVLIIGAGPTGLACAIDARRAGFTTVNIEKGCVVNSIFNYPRNMVFFTTRELLEIGDLPFSTPRAKPTREEALTYYRLAAERSGLDIRQYETVEQVAGADGDFRVRSRDRAGKAREYRARKLIVATGYYDLPNLMNIPGENLPKVSHYYREAHPYAGTDVLVIGAKNSAAEAALDLWRHGARVTLVHRGPAIHSNLKYWLKPDIENRLVAGEIKAYFNTAVQRIEQESVILRTPEGDLTLKNDFVLALTGYHPDFDFLRSLGIVLNGPECRPVCDPQTLESNVPGIYVAGVILAGSRTNEIFIENGRFHGGQIVADLRRRLAPPARR